MAKYEGELRGDFAQVMQAIDNAVMGGSATASREGASDFAAPGARCTVQVYERYSAFGGNRVSMSVTLFEAGGRLMVSVITSGGSQAMFMKINTLGEESFLNTVIGALEPYEM